MSTHAIPDGTTWVDSAGTTWVISGAGLTVTHTPWEDLEIMIEVLEHGATVGGDVVAQFGVSAWGDGTVWGSGDNWLEVTDDYISAEITSCSRQRWPSPFQPGRATIILDNASGAYSPVSAPEVSQLEAGRSVRISALLGGVSYPRFIGSITRVVDLSDVSTQPRVSVSLRSPLGSLARVTDRAPQPIPGFMFLDGYATRMDRVLDSARWPADARILEATGYPSDSWMYLTDSDLSGAALTELQGLALTEGGELFEDRDGNIVYRERANVEALAASTPAFTVAGYPDPGGEGLWLPWRKLTTTYDEADLANRVTVTKKEYTPIPLGEDLSTTVDDVASQVHHDMIASATFGPLWCQLLENDSGGYANGNDLASRVLARRSRVTERITGVELTPNADGAHGHYQPETVAVLEAYLGDPIGVRRMVGGVDQSEVAVIQGLEESWSPGRSSSHPLGRSDIFKMKITTDQYE